MKVKEGYRMAKNHPRCIISELGEELKRPPCARGEPVIFESTKKYLNKVI